MKYVPLGVAQYAHIHTDCALTGPVCAVCDTNWAVFVSEIQNLKCCNSNFVNISEHILKHQLYSLFSQKHFVGGFFGL